MISTKGRYALRVMIDLAEHTGSAPVPLKDVAQRQGISKKYLEIIVKDLVNAKLVSGTSGKGGGYKLLRDASDYTVGEIIESAEGPLNSVACLLDDAEPCERAPFCQTLPIWAEFDQLVHDFFYSKKLDALVDTKPDYFKEIRNKING